MAAIIRHPFVAGRFYPGTAQEIKDLLEKIRISEFSGIHYELADKMIYGAILPHAGHLYSGYETVHFFEILHRTKQEFDSFVILHPIHRGVAPEFACDASERWSTPLGEIDLDLDFIEKSGIPVSSEQQKWEHSAEVILPFIQYFIPYSFKIIPVGISHQTPEIAEKVSLCLVNATKKTGRKICIIASSDFTHYADPEKGKCMDEKVLEKIMNNDPEGIYRVIIDNNITVCGFGPIMTIICYLKKIPGDFKTTILRRGHSGEVIPSESVVDYISILFHG